MKIELKYLETGKGIEIGLSEKKSHKMENLSPQILDRLFMTSPNQ